MNIGIIGAGATGLTAGYMLAKDGHRVKVFECRKDWGGLVDTITAGEERLERFYHHIFTSDTEIIDLVNELGLTGQLSWMAPLNGLYINDKLYPFTSPLDLLRFKELSLAERVIMGLLVFKARFVKDWRTLENETAGEWIIRKAGRNVYEKVWKPLLNSKFDIDSERISAVWIWNKFKLRGSTRGKNMSTELLGYMDGSFKPIYDRLVDKIVENGGSVVCSRTVTGISPKADKTLDIETSDGCENFDRVIVTAAPQVLLEITPSLPLSYAEKLKKIRYKSNVCMIMELDRQLSPFYWITVADEKSPFVLVIEHTNLVRDKNYGSHIVYLSRYLDEENELYSASDEQIREVFTGYLKKMFPGWEECRILNSYTGRAQFAQPVVTTGYSEIRPEYATPVENLYLADMAQIYPEDRGQNYSIRMGKEIAREVSIRI